MKSFPGFLLTKIKLVYCTLLLNYSEGKSFLFSSSEMVSLLSPLNTLNHITQKKIYKIIHICEKLQQNRVL